MPVVSSLLSWLSAVRPYNEPVLQDDDADRAKVHDDEIDVPQDVYTEFFDTDHRLITTQYLEEKGTDMETAADCAPPSVRLTLSEPPAQLEREKIKVRVKAKDLKDLAGVIHKEYKVGAAQSEQLLIRHAAVHFEERRITVRLVDSERGFWVLHNDLPGPINVEESRFSVAKTGEGIDITLEKKASSKWPAQVKALKDLPMPTGKKSSEPSSPASSLAFLRTESPREGDVALKRGFFAMVAQVPPAPCG